MAANEGEGLRHLSYRRRVSFIEAALRLHDFTPMSSRALGLPASRAAGLRNEAALSRPGYVI